MRYSGKAAAVVAAWCMATVPALAERGEDDAGSSTSVIERAPRAERDPNGSGSNSFFLLDDVAPEIDREAVFARWARKELADPDSVKSLRLGPLFKAYSNLLPPVTDWMMCGEFNARGPGGGYEGLTQFLGVVRDYEGNGVWEIGRFDQRSRPTWREHCIPFMKEGQR